MNDPGVLYLVFGIAVVSIGALVVVPLARRSTPRAEASAPAPPVDITAWASELQLRAAAPGENPRYPQGLLEGARSGYSIKVFPSQSADVDGFVEDRFISVIVEGDRSRRWPTALDPRALEKLANAHPALAGPLRALLQQTSSVTLAVGRLAFPLPWVDTDGAPVSARNVADALDVAIVVARQLDDITQ